MASTLAQTESLGGMSASLVSDSASSAGGIYTGWLELKLRGFARARGGRGGFVISGGIAPWT